MAISFISVFLVIENIVRNRKITEKAEELKILMFIVKPYDSVGRSGLVCQGGLCHESPHRNQLLRKPMS